MLSTYLFPMFLGLAIHQVYRIKEPQMVSLLSLALTTLLPVVSSTLRQHFTRSWNLSTSDYLIFYGFWATSVIIYRISPFHPLSGIPGPWWLRVSKFYGLWVYSKGYQHKFFRHLHDQYGAIVRVGPNEISVCDVTAWKSILGNDGLPKGVSYIARSDPNATAVNIICLNGEAHAQRRRLWDHGMNSEALTEYAELISSLSLQMVKILESAEGPVDIAAWISYFSLDFTGEMAFGKGFGLLNDGGDTLGFWHALKQFIYTAALVSNVPWISKLVYQIPYISAPLTRIRNFARQTAQARVKEGAKSKDLWYYLTDEADIEVRKPTLPEVLADGAAAIIAGSDTVATTLTSLIYLLLTHPDAMERVLAEVDTVYPPGSNPLDRSMHDQLIFLDACLRESMRLYPPVPTNGARRIPRGSKGKLIAGKLIPEQTEVFFPPYCLHRNRAYFESPDSFIPGRWLGEESTITPDAYIPFSRGPANCAGRNLARQEMLMISSLLFQTFEFKIAEPADFAEGAWDEGLKDYFVSTRGPLRVFLTRRS